MEVVHLLLEAGIDPDKKFDSMKLKTVQGSTIKNKDIPPVSFAAYKGQEKILKHLLKAKAK